MSHQNYIIIAGILLLVFFVFFPTLYDIGNDEVLKNQPVNYLNILVKFIVVLAIIVIVPVLFGDNKDGFYFQLTPEKHCTGGNYMYSSDPQRKAFCAQFDKSDMARYECGPGFHGAPVWREGQGNQPPESNADWKNTRADNISDTYNDPQVL